MKYIITLILLIFTFNSKAKTSDKIDSLILDSLIYYPQKTILESLYHSYKSNNNKLLMSINKNLEELYNSRKSSIILYWYCYSKYNNSLFYLNQKDDNNAEKEIDKAIEKLENISNKTEEELALLAYLLNYSLQFITLKAPFISSKVFEYASQALLLDSQNIRAYLTLGINNFFTPKMFGGMSYCEYYFLNALSFPPQKTKSDLFPSWGRDEAYEYLIKYYIYIKDEEKAENYFEKALSEFPYNKNILELENKL